MARRRTRLLVAATATALPLLLTACGGAQSQDDRRMEAPSTRDRYEAKQRIQDQRDHMEALLQHTVEETGFGDAGKTPDESTENRSTTTGGGAVDTESDEGAAAPRSERRVHTTDACNRTCNVAEDLCFSSQEICSIASRYPSERDFQETCTWAINTCAGARDRCDTCSP